jgi:hypothetical protein
MQRQRWDSLPQFYEAAHDVFNLSFDEFVQWYNRWGYSLPDNGPVIEYQGGQFIMSYANLIPLPPQATPPRNKQELEKIEVML